MSGPSRIAVQAARGKTIPRRKPEWRQHIILRGVAKTSTPDDVHRAVTRVNCQGVKDIAIEYKQFVPQHVMLTLTHPDFTRPNLDKLRGLSIGGIPVTASAWELRGVPEPFDYKRTRGKQGRQESINRGVHKPSGDGPHGGLGGSGMNVAITGLPFELRMSELKELLNGYDLRSQDKNQTAVHNVQRDAGVFSPFRSAVVRLASHSEAQRLVRDLHGTVFPWKDTPIRHTLKAHIIY